MNRRSVKILYQSDLFSEFFFPSVTTVFNLIYNYRFQTGPLENHITYKHVLGVYSFLLTPRVEPDGRRLNPDPGSGSRIRKPFLPAFMLSTAPTIVFGVFWVLSDTGICLDFYRCITLGDV